MKKITAILSILCFLTVSLPEGSSAETPPLEENQAIASQSWVELATKHPISYLVSDQGFSEAPSAEVLASWWDAFGDDTLTALILESLENNRDLAAARSRLTQARAALGISKATVLPWLDSSNILTRTKTGKNGSSTGQQIGPIDFYSLEIDASWEIDIFGGRRQKVKASKADLQAQYGALHDSWVSLSSEVAVNYAALRTLQKRLEVAEKNLEIQTDTLDLLQSQYDSGLRDGLALNQARYTVEQTRSTIPPIRTAIEETLNRLSILVGRIPGDLGETLGDYRPLPTARTVDLVGIPANSVRQRPDIYSAERRLVAQIARKKEAQRDIWPKLYLLGSIGLEAFSSTSGLSVSDGESYSFGPSISFPLFHGGAIRNNIKVQTARQEEMLATYEQTVLNAVAEVRNALTAESQERERNMTLLRGVEAARNACEIARNRYENGLSDFIDVMSAQKALLSFEEQYAVSEGEMFSNIVRLFKALGGGWAPLDPDSTYVSGSQKKGQAQLSKESAEYLEQLRKETKN